MKKLTEMKTVVQGFRGLNDISCHCDVKIPLVDVLIVAICALFVGYENIEYMALYGVYRADWFKQKFSIERIPSESTIPIYFNVKVTLLRSMVKRSESVNA